MRYVSIRTQAYNIRLRRSCLFNLTYEVTLWREGWERWFLVRAEEAEDPAECILLRGSRWGMDGQKRN